MLFQFQKFALCLTLFVSTQVLANDKIQEALRSLEQSQQTLSRNENSYSEQQTNEIVRLASLIKSASENIGGSNPSACYAKAYRASGISYNEAMATELCMGGGSIETVDCYERAYRSSGISYDAPKAIRLCKFGGNPETVSCFEQAYRSSGISYDSDKALGLCQNRGSLATVKCFEKAYRASGISYDDKKALRLCSNSGSEQNVICFERQYRQNGYNAEAAIDLCKNN